MVAPLNWGLGHATRCIPIIREFIKQDCEVLVAADGRPLHLLKKEFPNLRFFELPGYDIEYPENGSMVLKMLASSSKIISGIKREKKATEKIVEQENIDIVFSDNRYGCRSDKALSVFMTHQLFIQCPAYLKWLEPLIFIINKNYFSKFDSLWIPDFETEPNLSGKLSHKKKINPEASGAKFIGPLSRFEKQGLSVKTEYDLIAICSGPEPQRTIFENLLREAIIKTNLKSVLVRGVTEDKDETKEAKNLLTINYLNSEKTEQYILQSNIVVCRPGYSSIMDLAALGKNAIFIPTPGQTEQEYLAKYFHENNFFLSQSQKDFNLENTLSKSKSFTGLKMEMTTNLLSEAIKELLQQTKK